MDHLARRRRAPGSSLLLALWALVGCQGAGPTIGSETHFLRRCPTSGSCDAGLTCLCGACSLACDSTTSCSGHSEEATCVPVAARSAEQSCGEADVAATCEVSCSVDADCLGLAADHHCDRGYCRKLAVDCERATSAAEGVVLLGDLFFADNGQLTVELQNLARSVGALAAGQTYRDYSSALVSPFGESDELFSQYQVARADGPAEVVILDAGGPDALVSCPEPQTQDCASLQNAAQGTRALLAQFSADGVQDVVLFFYPDPADALLLARFDLLRPLLQAACEEGPMSCVFVDLRPTFTGHEQELLAPGGLLPTPAGSAAAAAAIFSAMEQACIAQ